MARALIVISPFGTYEKGNVIIDEDEIDAVLEDAFSAQNVVEINPMDEPSFPAD